MRAPVVVTSLQWENVTVLETENNSTVVVCIYYVTSELRLVPFSVCHLKYCF